MTLKHVKSLETTNGFCMLELVSNSLFDAFALVIQNGSHRLVTPAIAHNMKASTPVFINIKFVVNKVTWLSQLAKQVKETIFVAPEAGNVNWSAPAFVSLNQ